MMDWEDICIAYDEDRVRCTGCGVPAVQGHKCKCGEGKATPVPRGVAYVINERETL